MACASSRLTTPAEQSSQWDGLRHFSQTVPGQTERVFYGGARAWEITDAQSDRLGIHHWAQEGIAGTLLLNLKRVALVLKASFFCSPQDVGC
jgi:hypothetical protein